MSTRSIALRNLLVLVAVLATIVVLGCWDNRREMARVVEQGYATEAQITGAQFQRTAPFALDGWRPRFVEQALSVDLQWTGKDGKTHLRKKVPVSDRFGQSIVNGEQVKLITVPVKVIDDDTSVPVLTFDAARRLDSLKEWLAGAGYLALAAWGVVAAIGIRQWRRKRRPATATATVTARAIAPPGARNIPAQRLLIGILALGVGGFLAVTAWSSGDNAGEARGAEVNAEIVAASGPPYIVQLGWKDGQGGVHHFGPLPISEGFWKKITRDGKLAVHETKVRLNDDAPMGRPLILEDPPTLPWQTKAVLAVGLLLAAIGAGCLLMAARAMRRF